MQSVDERWSSRSDAWTRQDDEKLASIVLKHIRTGSTQLKAFEEAATELGRTAAACGYRWNGVLRKERREDIEGAKLSRKSAQRTQAVEKPSDQQMDPQTPTTMTSSDSMSAVVKFLQTYDAQYQKLRQQVQELERERNELKSKLRQTEHQSVAHGDGSPAPMTPEQLEQDSQALFAIMERARKLLEPRHK
ncbi:RsfA family transcriptional regulator [Alicyclobacillus sp. SO9]|uniref:RsfA family transcriptional regulator n=1 Tax=Alicyclobacillus sp. SO9 TaxID=2665646 RepID=UPI0018E79319|nr:RsfA family transcriptional regulator [Alicyclobacillus sp. SO9]QQE79487.1 RsfA family transcriptional regulator [Alicyclobacillus sp. SO9]